MYGTYHIRSVSVGLDSQIWYLFIYITGYLNVRKISETMDFRTFVGPLVNINTAQRETEFSPLTLKNTHELVQLLFGNSKKCLSRLAWLGLVNGVGVVIVSVCPDGSQSLAGRWGESNHLSLLSSRGPGGGGHLADWQRPRPLQGPLDSSVFLLIGGLKQLVKGKPQSENTRTQSD